MFHCVTLHCIVTAFSAITASTITPGAKISDHRKVPVPKQSALKRCYRSLLIHTQIYGQGCLGSDPTTVMFIVHKSCLQHNWDFPVVIVNAHFYAELVRDNDGDQRFILLQRTRLAQIYTDICIYVHAHIHRQQNEIRINYLFVMNRVIGAFWLLGCYPQW